MSIKAIKLDSKSNATVMSFDELLKRYKAFIGNEAFKFKRDSMFGDPTVDKDDIEQVFLMTLYNAYNEYSIERGTTFSTFLYYKMRGAKSSILSNRLQKRHGGYKDEEGHNHTIGNISLDIPKDDFGDHNIIDDNLMIDDMASFVEIIDMLESIKTKNNIENAIIYDMINVSILNGHQTPIQEIADSNNVSRQYVYLTRQKLVKRIIAELEK